MKVTKTKKIVISLTLAVAFIVTAMPASLAAAQRIISTIVAPTLVFENIYLDSHENLQMSGFDSNAGKWVYFDARTGEKQEDSENNSTYKYSNESGLTSCYENEKYGFKNDKGEIVIPAVYDAADWQFNDGFASVRKGDWETGKWGFIDTKGEIAVPLEYDYVGIFRNGFAEVAIGEFPDVKWGLVNESGEVVVPIKYVDIKFTGAENNVSYYWLQKSGDDEKSVWGIIATGTSGTLPECKCNNCEDCGFFGGIYGFGSVLGNGTVGINDALEILKYLAKLESAVNHDPDSLIAACITNTDAKAPSINDALEILKYLAKLDSKITDDIKRVSSVYEVKSVSNTYSVMLDDIQPLSDIPMSGVTFSHTIILVAVCAGLMTVCVCGRSIRHSKSKK